MVVNPKNADVVYVAALGALYRANEERGIYRTIDGGKSWVKVKYLDEDVGFVDIHLFFCNVNEMLGVKQPIVTLNIANIAVRALRIISFPVEIPIFCFEFFFLFFVDFF